MRADMPNTYPSNYPGGVWSSSPDAPWNQTEQDCLYQCQTCGNEQKVNMEVDTWETTVKFCQGCNAQRLHYLVWR